MMSDIINTQNLSKHYRDVHAVSELSLNVRKGEIYGFLGLNGAGKTTTIRMLLGMIRPTSGYAFIKGRKVTERDAGLWKDIGYLVEIPYSYPNLTVRENLGIIRRLKMLPDRDSVNNIIDRLKLTQYAHKKAGNLSLGNAQRLGLAKALIHKPEILILDEPANGLDPAGIFEIRRLLKSLAADEGVTIFISSHILGEISKFATRIGIIHEGKLVKELDTSQLDILCRKTLVVRTKDNSQADFVLRNKGFDFCHSADDSLICVDEKVVTQPENIAVLLVNSGLPPSLLQVKEEDLESFFFKTIGINGGIS